MEGEAKMPWEASSVMSLRIEFVLLASAEGANIRTLCRRFGISPTTGYKWLCRYQTESFDGLKDQSRRPRNSPRRSSDEVEQLVVKLRHKHPAWGGRKLRAPLEKLLQRQVPAASTITAILHRHQLITPEASEQHQPYQRFEHPHPNDLWQMDFKGHFALEKGRCYPLTVLDDNSRFATGLVACGNQTTKTVEEALTEVFRRYGLPYRMNMDNGTPWCAYVRAQRHWTQLGLWLLRLGIRVSFSRPHHPQTNGKNERFHRTLKLELLRDHAWRSLVQCQPEFDRWRDIYNCERPHEALGLATPVSRYQPSVRPFPERLPPIEYPAGEIVRKVEGTGYISFQNHRRFIGEAFRGLHVVLRHTTTEGLFEVFFLHQRIASLDLRKPEH
jgi:transposase InsO family protein